MKLAIIVSRPPWSSIDRFYLRCIEEGFSPCAILTVSEHGRRTSVVKRMLRKHGPLGVWPRLAALAWYRLYTRRIRRLQDRHFSPLAGVYSPGVPLVDVECLQSAAFLGWMDRERPDVVIPIAGGIIRPELLARSRWIRWHHGITPDIRGLASPYWAIYAQRPAWLGVTIQELVEKLDAGPILAQERLTPTRGEDLASTYLKLDLLALELLLRVLGQFRDGRLVPTSCDPSRGEYRSLPTLASLIRFPFRARGFFREFGGDGTPHPRTTGPAG